MTLTEFLLARIAEDEADEREVAAARAEAWEHGRAAERAYVESIQRVHHWSYIGTEKPVPPTNPYRTDRKFVADRQPRRVLDDCEAKRRIVAQRVGIDQEVRRIALDDPDQANALRMTRLGLDFALQSLAAVYADHPDYRDEWRG